MLLLDLVHRRLVHCRQASYTSPTVPPRSKRFLGAFFGAFAAGFCGPLGRRGSLILGCLLFIVGGILQTAAKVVAMLYAGHLIAGFGIGILVEVSKKIVNLRHLDHFDHMCKI
jgi:hypothetical protein